MTVLRAALLGLVQGLTEFLPVSSDGHLALFQAAFGEGSLALDVALHAGTLLSMLLFFRSDLVRLLAGLTSRTDDEPRALERRRLLLIVIATVPTGLIGLGLKHTVERLSMSLVAAGLGFLITAAFLLAGERRGRREGGLSLRDIPLWHPVVIGLAQGAAVWPGWSRSASTIGLALVLGWRWDDAGRFSFLAAMPAIVGAILLTARDIAALPPAPAAVGFLVSFAIGTLSLKILMRFLAARRLWPFALYCLGLGLFALLKSV